MTLYHVMKELLDGAKIRRSNWPDDEYISVVHEDKIIQDEEGVEFLFDYANFVAEDWEFID